MNIPHSIKPIALSMLVTFAVSLSGFVHAETAINSHENKVISRQVIHTPANKVSTKIRHIDGLENFIPEILESPTVEGSGIDAELIGVHRDCRTIVEKVVAFDETDQIDNSFTIQALTKEAIVYTLADAKRYIEALTKVDVSIQRPTL